MITTRLGWLIITIQTITCLKMSLLTISKPMSITWENTSSKQINLNIISSLCKVVMTYVFLMLRTYVMILCNWLILWQNALYLYLGRLRMCLNLQETTFQNQVLKPSSLFKKSSKEWNFIKNRQLVDSFLTPPICRGLRILEFNYDFLRIHESVSGFSFLLTLDI